MQLQFFIFPTMVLFFSLPVFGLPADTEMNAKRQLLTDTRPAPPPMANPPPVDFVKRQIHTDPKPAPPPMANTPSSDLSGPARASSHSVSVELCRHERFQECSIIEMTHGKCYGPMDLRNHAVGRNEMTSYKVMNGCCSFYEGDDCKSKFMFDAYNRSDERLGNHHNDKMNSIKCNAQCQW